MKVIFRRFWPAVKLVLALIILLVIGRQFYRDLQRPELWQRSIHWGWLLGCGLLYLLGLAFSAWYWSRLLGHLQERPSTFPMLRAYYVGHLGKYLPGKAWALILRSTLIRGTQGHAGQGISLGVATLTAFYEVITTMAAGALAALVLFALLGTDQEQAFRLEKLWRLLTFQDSAEAVGGLGQVVVVILSAGLLALFLGPLLPPIFNRLVHRLSLPFRDPEVPLSRVRWSHLGEGLVITGVGWLFLGVSLGLALNAIVGENLHWTPEAVGRLPAILALSYVAGFAILIAPNGLGVREYLLTILLAPELARMGNLQGEEARATVVLVVLVLRLVWTVAELSLAGVLYFLPGQRVRRVVVGAQQQGG